MLSAEVETSDRALLGVCSIESGDIGPVSADRMLLIGEGVCLDFTEEVGVDSLASLRPIRALLKAEAPEALVGDAGTASFGGTGGGGGSLDGCAGLSKVTLTGVCGNCSPASEGPEVDLDNDVCVKPPSAA